MKRQHIIWFILGMGLLSSLCGCTSVTAQNTPNIVVMRPALPKIVRIKMCEDKIETVDYAKQCVREGYIIKSISGTSQYGYSWCVVAEKY